jgi:hypothetical protein
LQNLYFTKYLPKADWAVFEALMAAPNGVFNLSENLFSEFDTPPEGGYRRWGSIQGAEAVETRCLATTTRGSPWS